MSLKLLPIVLLLLPACGGPAKAKPDSKTRTADPRQADILPFDATERTLSNGLKVIVVPTGFPNLVSLQIAVQTGSRNEVEPGKSGFAHFFEHMMFRGTKRFPSDAYEKIITRAGARQNAYTTDDYTNYHVTFAREDLPQILEIEADRFQNLDYSEEDFRTEARAVLGEYNKNFANPIQKLLEVQRNIAYQTHTYKHTTMGFLEDIMAMPEQSEYARTFFERWYRPEYTTIIVAGDVEPAQVLKLVERLWGSWERGSYTADVPQEPAPRGPVYEHVDWSSPTLPWLTVAFHGPAFSETDKDAVALDMALELEFGETSTLYQRLVVDEQKVDALGYMAADSKDPSLAMVYARIKDAADALYIRDSILGAVARARTGPVDAVRLAEAKSNSRYSFARALDNSDAIASTLARFVHFDRRFDTLNNLFRLYAALTPEDVLAASQRYLTDERLVVTTLAHGGLPAGIEKQPALASLQVEPAAAQATASGAPQPRKPAPPAKPGRLLAKVPFVVQRTQNPQLALKLHFAVGSARDPLGKEGLAALTAEMIADAGSASRRYEEIQKALFPVAGAFNAQVDREMTVFNGSIHSDNLATFIDVALEQLTAPGFRDEDFQRVRERQRNALVQDLRANNDEELGKEVLQALLFVGTPYGHTSLGTIAGIDAITLDDVRAFARENYCLARLTVGVAGDAGDKVMSALKSELARLPAGEPAPQGKAPAARKLDGMQVAVIEKDTRATAISMGFPIGVTRGHADFPALHLARTWLGEHRSSMSRLYQRIREVRGMNYGDYAYIEAFPGGMFQFFPSPNRARKAQLFEIWIRPVRPDQAQHAIRIALHELDQLVQNGLSEEDFESTREYLMKNVYLLTSTQSSQLGYELDSRFYGTPEYTKYMRQALSKLTREDVNRAIAKHFASDGMLIVAVTKDAAALREQLVADAPSTMTYDAEKPKELLEEDVLIGARKLRLAPQHVQVIPVERVFSD